MNNSFSRMTDDDMIMSVIDDPEATPRELELALRLEALLSDVNANEELESRYPGACD